MLAGNDVRLLERIVKLGLLLIKSALHCGIEKGAKMHGSVQLCI